MDVIEGQCSGIAWETWGGCHGLEPSAGLTWCYTWLGFGCWLPVQRFSRGFPLVNLGPHMPVSFPSQVLILIFYGSNVFVMEIHLSSLFDKLQKL